MLTYTINQDIQRVIINDEFVNILKMKWDELHDKSNVFKYKIVDIHERIVDCKFLLQLNPNRATKRRIPELIDKINQPFDKNKFNFTKVSNEELLFDIQSITSDNPKQTVMVNVSPISRYHSLLCPSIDQCLPQVVTEDSLQLVLDIMRLAKDRDLRIGFNSLCALASVNHLHYHLFIESHDLPVEFVKCKQVKNGLYRFENYPVPAFCFQDDETSEITAKHVFTLVSYFLENSIAHNIFITRGRDVRVGNDGEVSRVIIWPRKSSCGVKQLTAFNVAVCELSGWFPVFDEPSFNNLSALDLESELMKWKYDDFDNLCEQLQTLF